MTCAHDSNASYRKNPQSWWREVKLFEITMSLNIISVRKSLLNWRKRERAHSPLIKGNKVLSNLVKSNQHMFSLSVTFVARTALQVTAYHARISRWGRGWRAGRQLEGAVRRRNLGCRIPNVFTGKLPTYPSPKPTFYPKWEVSVNVGLREG